MRLAVASALGRAAVPAGILFLVHIALKGMLMTRIKLASTAALAALALTEAGVMAARAGLPDVPEAAPREAP